MSHQPGTRLKVGPMSGLGTDPYWLTITAVSPEGDVTFVDEDGMGDEVPAAIWAEEYEPRVLEAVEPDANPDEPPAEEAPEEIPFGNDPPPDPAPPAEPAPSYMARNIAQNVESLTLAGVDPRAALEALAAHDPADHAPTPRERLADLVIRKYNCHFTYQKLYREMRDLDRQMEVLLASIAKEALLAEPTPALSDPLATALGEAIEERAPQEPPAEPEEAPTTQAQAISEGVAAKVKNETADTEYETVARLEMNRGLAEVRGISGPQAARMAEKGIKTLANFIQVTDEHPDSWFDGIMYINKVKADVIYDAVADHFSRFKKKYGRE